MSIIIPYVLIYISYGALQIVTFGFSTFPFIFRYTDKYSSNKCVHFQGTMKVHFDFHMF